VGYEIDHVTFFGSSARRTIFVLGGPSTLPASVLMESTRSLAQMTWGTAIALKNLHLARIPSTSPSASAILVTTRSTIPSIHWEAGTVDCVK
jgi:hypothetical protein